MYKSKNGSLLCVCVCVLSRRLRPEVLLRVRLRCGRAKALAGVRVEHCEHVLLVVCLR